MNPTLCDRIREICAAADAEHASRIDYVRDYMIEKDSYISNDEAKRLIWLYVDSHRDERHE